MVRDRVGGKVTEFGGLKFDFDNLVSQLWRYWSMSPGSIVSIRDCIVIPVKYFVIRGFCQQREQQHFPFKLSSQ